MGHPAPEDFDGLLDAWSASLREIRQIGGGLTPQQWALPTACPGWSVGDVVAHIVDIEANLAGLPRPAHEPDWASLGHVASDFGRMTEVGVDVRRGRPQQDVLDELDELIDLRGQQLQDVPHDLTAQVPAFGGAPAPLGRVLRMRIFDAWVHEQDIRDAVGEPGGLDAPGAHVTASLMIDSLPRTWAKAVQAPAGAILGMDITGPGVTALVRVGVGEDGRAGFTDAGDPTVWIRGSWPAVMHLMSGRTSPDDLVDGDTLQVDGDRALIDRLMPALNISP